MSVFIRRGRGALVDDLGYAVGQWAVHDVRVPGDPADVGGAPVHVGLGFDVEHVVMRVRGLGQVPAGGVHDALGLAGRAGRVEQKQRMLGVERLRCVLDRGGLDGVVPPQIATLRPRHVDAGAPHHQDVLHAVLAVDRLVGRFFQRYRAAAAILPVGGDQQLGLGVFDAGAQRGCREPGEHDAVHHPEPCAGQHRDDRFGHHRHVDRDAVAGFQAEVGQRVGRLRHVGQQLRVRQGAAVTEGFAFPVDRDAVAVAGLDMAVHAVVGHVELAADEPFRERRARPVEHVGERRLPGQPVRLLRPERPTCRASAAW